MRPSQQSRARKLSGQPGEGGVRGERNSAAAQGTDLLRAMGGLGLIRHRWVPLVHAIQ